MQGSPIYDSLSIASIRDFLLPPHPKRDGDIHPDLLSPKRASPDFGPGGFSSTRPYPSRLASSSRSSSGTASPTRNRITSVSHRKSFSQPTNVPTAAPITSSRLSVPVPKPIIRASIIMLLLIACTLLVAAPASYTLKSHHAHQIVAESTLLAREGAPLPSSTILKHLRSQRQAATGVKGQLMANPKGEVRTKLNPEDLLDDRQRTYRPPVSRPLPDGLELMAIQAYLLEDDTNTLSKSLDGSKPVDAYSVLGMTVTDAVTKELKENAYPVVVWEMGDVWTTPIKTLLDLYALEPAPIYLPLMKRPDLPVLEAILKRLVGDSSASPFPLVTIAGQAIGGYEALHKLHKDDVLHVMLERGGAQVDGYKIRQQKEDEKAMKRREVRQAVVPRK